MPSTLTPTLVVSTMPTPLGPLTLVASDGHLVAGGFTEDVALLTARLHRGRLAAPPRPVARLGTIADAVAAYFAGEVRALDQIAVAQPGGPFQQRVWLALRAIPPGRTTTYRELAVRLGGAQLARAVGMGCATNLIAPIVPCHRVTGSDGDLTGYYWGLDRKRWLLDHERRHAEP